MDTDTTPAALTREQEFRRLNLVRIALERAVEDLEQLEGVFAPDAFGKERELDRDDRRRLHEKVIRASEATHLALFEIAELVEAE